jgi:hypothetical protein
MNLDVNTLFLVTVYVEVILGLLLLFAWAQNTAVTAVAWWGFSDLLRAGSIMMFGQYCQRAAVYRICFDLDGHAGLRSPQAQTDIDVRRRGAVARRQSRAVVLARV